MSEVCKKEADYYAIKMPVFSFEKLRGADIALGPEMKSTGECLGISKTFNGALYKAFLECGASIFQSIRRLLQFAMMIKEEIVDIARRFKAVATRSMRQRNRSSTSCKKWIHFI